MDEELINTEYSLHNAKKKKMAVWHRRENKKHLETDFKAKQEKKVKLCRCIKTK